MTLIISCYDEKKAQLEIRKIGNLYENPTFQTNKTVLFVLSAQNIRNLEYNKNKLFYGFLFGFSIVPLK
jgi:hypothetical protein